jgi:DNA-binding NtrC family response regulator
MARILVIDDDDQLRAMLRQALEMEGHEVLDAENGLVGVQRFARKRPDLAIVDIIMPEKEGFACIMEIRGIDPDAPLIAISGGSQLHGMDVIEVAKHFGACRAFWKPFDVGEVVGAVRDELEKRRAA